MAKKKTTTKPKAKKPAKAKAVPVESPAVSEPVVGRTYTPEQIKATLAAHCRWLKGEVGGIRANLQYADLRSADLRSADLQSADLQYANLQYANLQYANLQYADLRSADLRSADLRSADLQSADLQSADLQYANLQYADLRSADLRSAKNSELAIARTRILPEGDLVGWKKCRNGVIVKLSIPASAKRSHAFGRKCRAEFATVLEVIGADVGIAQHDGKTKYVAGETVKPHEWCEDFTSECAGGIHFYITRIEAENH